MMVSGAFKYYDLKKISFLFLIGIVLISSISCSSSTKEKDAGNTDHMSESEGWINLFDGESFDGWRILGSDSVFTAYWKIEGGVLKKLDRGKVPERADGQPREGGDLMTKETFDNYELSWEWALFENGNSGLKYNVSEEMSMDHGSEHSALGFEYQMIDGSSEEYTDLKPSQFSGSLYDLLSANNVQLVPFGEFNQSRIRIDGDQVTHWLNGQKVLSYSFGSSELKAAYEKSKFAEIPGFINKRKGHIILQDHITEAWFRNIRLKKL